VRSVVRVLREAAGNGVSGGVRTSESGSGRGTVAVARGGETAVVRVYARVDFVSHVRGVGTGSRV
jgi:hypothetical protein